MFSLQNFAVKDQKLLAGEEVIKIQMIYFLDKKMFWKIFSQKFFSMTDFGTDSLTLSH